MLTGFSPPQKFWSLMPPKQIKNLKKIPWEPCPQTPLVIEHYNIPCYLKILYKTLEVLLAPLDSVIVAFAPLDENPK